MRYTDNLCKMFFLSNSLLPLSLVIYPFSEICLRSVHRSPRLVYLSVLEDDNRGNMTVHIVIDNKGETVFHLLTVTGDETKYCGDQ